MANNPISMVDPDGAYANIMEFQRALDFENRRRGAEVYEGVIFGGSEEISNI